MNTKVVIPKTGMGIEDVVLVRWLKQVGDRVRQGEPIAELETAKAMFEIEAPMDGVLVKTYLAPGEAAKVDAEAAEIEGP